MPSAFGYVPAWELRPPFGRLNRDGRFHWASYQNRRTPEPPPNRMVQPGRMEEKQTEDRRRDDPDACAYAPPAVEVFCYPCPATAPGLLALAALLSDPRRRLYRLKELCQNQ